jgi:hypothetical protein
MKFRIVKNVPGGKVASRVGSKYRDLLPTLVEQDRFTLILFKARRDEKTSRVVMSSAARQAVDRLGEVSRGERVFALAGDFTSEARAVFDHRGIEVVSSAFFGWTDERYQLIKNPPS